MDDVSGACEVGAGGAGTIEINGWSEVIAFSFDSFGVVLRRRLGCGLTGLRTVEARETFEFTDETTDVVSRCRCRIFISPFLFHQIVTVLCNFGFCCLFIWRYGAGRRCAYVHRFVDHSALVPKFARSLSRTFTGGRPGSLIMVVVGDDFVTNDPGLRAS